MYLSHIGFSLELIALIAGVSLYIWSLRTQGAGTSIGAAIGFLVIILAILAIICNVYYTTKYWYEGDFNTPMSMHEMQNNMMMDKNQNNTPAY
jgi:hypothetical protein